MRNKVLIAIGIIICLFLVGLISDVVRLHLAKNMYERCLEDAIKKGAVLIDTPLAAKAKIIQVAKTYGLSLKNDEVTISQSQDRIVVTALLSIKTYFAWLVGKKALSFYVQKQADILRKIQPVTELETIPLGIIRPKGINFGFLYKLAMEPQTNLLEEKLVGLDFEGISSKTLKAGNIIKLRSLEENELEGLITLIIFACPTDCKINNFHPRCHKLLEIAVVEPLIPPMVKVAGFACFFIEGVTEEGITGYFIEHYQTGVSDEGIDFGLRTRSKIEVRIRE